jgi:hypothetical protein
MIDNNGGGGVPQSGYNNNPNAQLRAANENSNNAGGISHHSAVRNFIKLIIIET